MKAWCATCHVWVIGSEEYVRAHPNSIKHKKKLLQKAGKW